MEHLEPNQPDLSRRSLLGGGSKAALAALATAPAWLPRIAHASPGSGPTRDTLVNIFLRGGIDGMSAVAPYLDGNYYTLRPNIAVPPPGQTNGALDLDGFFGLPPAGAPLLTPYNDDNLLIVHATGSTDPTRSHFDAMHRMETATPEQPGAHVTSGWIARHLQTINPLGSGAFRGLAFEHQVPRALVEGPGVLPIPDPSNFAFPGFANSENARRTAIANMYARAPQPLSGAAASSLATIDILAQIDFDNYAPENGAVYGQDEFAQGLRAAAALIKADVGLEAIELDLGGWDHHENIGAIGGIFAYLYAQLTAGLEAFYLDLLGYVDQYTLVAMSEFGRTAGENGSLGTDHGHGNVMFLMGGHIDGGRVLANWPGLAPGQLDIGDLANTLDYRHVLAEIVSQRLGNANLSEVFPGFQAQFPGVTN